MGRKEKHVDTANEPVAEFALALRKVRQAAGNPTYRQMAAKVHFSAPALSKAASGRKLPTWPVAEAYLRACGVTELKPWADDWTITDAMSRLKAKGGRSGDRATKPSPVSASGRQRLADAGCGSRKSHLLTMLDEIRNSKGLSLRAVAARSQAIQKEAVAVGRSLRCLSSTTVHEVLSGRRRLDDDFLRLFLVAVDASAEQQYEVGLAFGLLDREMQEQAASPASGPAPAPAPAPLPARRRRPPDQTGEAKRHVGRAAVVPKRETEPVEEPDSGESAKDVLAVAARACAQPWPRRPPADSTGSWPAAPSTGTSTRRRPHRSVRAEVVRQRTVPTSRVRCHRTKAGYYGVDNRRMLVSAPAERRALLVIAATLVLAGLGAWSKAFGVPNMTLEALRETAAQPGFAANVFVAAGVLLGMLDLILLFVLQPFEFKAGLTRIQRLGTALWQRMRSWRPVPGGRIEVVSHRRRGTIGEALAMQAQLVVRAVSGRVAVAGLVTPAIAGVGLIAVGLMQPQPAWHNAAVQSVVLHSEGITISDWLTNAIRASEPLDTSPDALAAVAVTDTPFVEPDGADAAPIWPDEYVPESPVDLADG